MDIVRVCPKMPAHPFGQSSLTERVLPGESPRAQSRRMEFYCYNVDQCGHLATHAVRADLDDAAITCVCPACTPPGLPLRELPSVGPRMFDALSILVDHEGRTKNWLAARL